MINKPFRNILFAALIGGLSTFATSAGPAMADAPQVPQTVEDHTTLAKKYQDKAAVYRKESQEHEEMAAAYKKSSANAQEARGQKNPFVVKMEKHCAAIAKAAVKLAVDNEKAADYHTLRAKELQGQ
jgi:type IV secretory pathway VirB10-like protein